MTPSKITSVKGSVFKLKRTKRTVEDDGGPKMKTETGKMDELQTM